MTELEAALANGHDRDDDPLAQDDDYEVGKLRWLDLRIVAATQRGWIVYCGKELIGAFTDWKDCLKAVKELMLATAGEPPAPLWPDVKSDEQPKAASRFNLW